LYIAAQKKLVQPKKPSRARKCHQLSTTLAASSVSDQKVLNPLPGTKLRSQPAGLFAAATPCFGGLVWVTVFREDSRIWSTTWLSLMRPHCLKSLSELAQALFKDGLFISDPRRQHFRNFISQRP
jgi:hypothetical protein